jgi:hypothetical protein
MYSRVTLLEIDTMRATVEEAVRLFEEQVLPGLREHEGYDGVVVLATPEGKGMIVSLWETEEASAAAAGFATEALERFVTLFRSPPDRELYEVLLTELPDVALR